MSMKRILHSVMAGVVLVLAAESCEQDPLTIGSGVVSDEPFTTGKAVYDVFAYNKAIEAFPTNRLPLYQLGVLNHPVYGTSEGRITTQVQLADGIGNPVFGIYPQDVEDSDPEAIPENETVTSVRLYLPFFQDASADSDSDGVIDALDAEPDNSTNDSDGDGLTNAQERTLGTNPLNTDTDGDGTPDGEDTSTPSNTYPIVRDLDSIYGDRTQSFTFKVEQSTYFLEDLDPQSGYQSIPLNYSNQSLTPDFAAEVLFEGPVTISDEDIITFKEDDPETELDESLTVDERLLPGIVVSLDSLFFQQNFLDKEGSYELLSNSNFRNFLRGLHLSITPAAQEEMMILFDLTRARLTVFYEYDRKDETEGTTREKSRYDLRLLRGGGTQVVVGNAVNTVVKADYPAEVQEALASQDNASRIYLKGGGGTFAEIDLFDALGGGDIINSIKQKNWIINAAYLVLYVDRERLDRDGGVAEPPRLYLYNAENNRPLYNPVTETTTSDSPYGAYLNYDGFLQKEGDSGVKYSINITEHINNIVIRDSANARLGLTLTPDLRISGSAETLVPDGAGGSKKLPVSANICPLGTVLVGSNVATDDPKRLALEVYYTQIDP